jgi:uncharacterized protein (DUF1501 family)
MSRRTFVRGGVTACSVGLVAPRLLWDSAFAQSASTRALVVLHLMGGNDALSMLVPYQDPFYYSRRPTLAVPAGSVLPIGTDSEQNVLGLHPSLTGMREIFARGSLAIIQRVGYANQSRSHFTENDVWSSADPLSPRGDGWLGRYLETLPADPLGGWSTSSTAPHALEAGRGPVPAIPNPDDYRFMPINYGNTGENMGTERTAMARILSHLRPDLPHLAPVLRAGDDAFDTVDRVVPIAKYVPAVDYPNDGLGLALQSVAGAIVTGVGSRIFWVETDGYDTHAGQGTNGGHYASLMRTFDAALLAFQRDLTLQGVWNDTLLLQFSEFGRRITENSSRGTDHGAASVMLAMGGMVHGGLYGTAASLDPNTANPDLERDGSDVRFETDFRAVYAQVIDRWLGGNSVDLLGADFRTGAPAFL